MKFVFSPNPLWLTGLKVLTNYQFELSIFSVCFSSAAQSVNLNLGPLFGMVSSCTSFQHQSMEVNSVKVFIYVCLKERLLQEVVFVKCVCLCTCI